MSRYKYEIEQETLAYLLPCKRSPLSYFLQSRQEKDVPLFLPPHLNRRMRQARVPCPVLSKKVGQTVPLFLTFIRSRKGGQLSHSHEGSRTATPFVILSFTRSGRQYSPTFSYSQPLSLSICIYFHLSLSISIYLYISLYISICTCFVVLFLSL